MFGLLTSESRRTRRRLSSTCGSWRRRRGMLDLALCFVGGCGNMIATGAVLLCSALLGLDQTDRWTCLSVDGGFDVVLGAAASYIVGPLLLSWAVFEYLLGVHDFGSGSASGSELSFVAFAGGIFGKLFNRIAGGYKLSCFFNALPLTALVWKLLIHSLALFLVPILGLLPSAAYAGNFCMYNPVHL